MKKLLCFLSGALLVAILWRFVGVSPSFPISFTLSPNTTAFLAYRNEITGKMKMMEIKANVGDTIRVAINTSKNSSAMELKQLFDAGLGTEDAPKKEALKKIVFKSNIGHVEIVKIDHTLFELPRFQYRWQDPHNPLLIYLKQREKLDKLLKREASEIKKFLLLQNWVRLQWKPSLPNPYPRWNCVEILHAIRSGKTGGFCGQYTQVLVQVLASFGYQARYVWLKDHIVVEVWSNEFGKWITLDPFFAAIFSDGKQYLNCYEVYKKLKENQEKAIYIYATIEKKFIKDIALRKKILNTHQHFDIYTKSDHIEDNQPPDQVLDEYWKYSICYIDKYFRQRKFSGGKRPLTTFRLKDLYFSLNQVEINPIQFLKNSLVLRFRSHCPYPAPKPFLVGNNKYTPTGKIYKWQLKPGINILKVRSLNVANNAGTEATIEVNYTPNQK